MINPKAAAMTPYTVMIDYRGVWSISIFIMLCVFASSIIFQYRERIGFWACTFWCYVVLHGLYLTHYPEVHFQNYLMAFRASAGQTLIESILVPLAVIEFGPWLWRMRSIWMSALCAYAAYCAYIDTPGLMLAISFNNALAVLCLPFVSIYLVLPVLAIVLTRHSGTAQLMLACQAVLIVWNWMRDSHRPFQWSRYIAMLGGILVSILSVYLVFHYQVAGPWWEGNGRFALMIRSFSIWEQSMQAILVGFGPGTFLYISTIMDHFQAPMFFQMHSDFLQIAFEHGILGWSLAMMVFIQAVRNSWNNRPLIRALVMIFVFCLTYHPMRFAPTQLILALIFYRALIENKTNLKLPNWDNHIRDRFH